MAQFSVKIMRLNGSVLGEKQQIIAKSLASGFFSYFDFPMLYVMKDGALLGVLTAFPVFGSIGLCCANRVLAEVPLSPDRLIPRLP